MSKHFANEVLVGIELELFPRNSEVSLIRGIVEEFGFILKPEKTAPQLEIVTPPTANLLDLCSAITDCRQKLSSLANFSAKPYRDYPGSSMQFNVSPVEDFALGGVLALLNLQMSYFAPSTQCYERYLFPDIFTPRYVNWGRETRSVAVRMRQGSWRETYLEHRVASASCNVKEALEAILLAMVYGIFYKINLPERRYSYNLQDPPLISRVEEAYAKRGLYNNIVTALIRSISCP